MSVNVQDEEIAEELACLEELNTNPKNKLPEKICDENYFELVEYLEEFLTPLAGKIEGLPELPELDESAEPFKDVEKKLAINHMEGAIAVEDINSLGARGSFRDNRLWLLYVCIFLERPDCR